MPKPAHGCRYTNVLTFLSVFSFNTNSSFLTHNSSLLIQNSLLLHTLPHGPPKWWPNIDVLMRCNRMCQQICQIAKLPRILTAFPLTFSCGIVLFSFCKMGRPYIGCSLRTHQRRLGVALSRMETEMHTYWRGRGILLNIIVACPVSIHPLRRAQQSGILLGRLIVIAGDKPFEEGDLIGFGSGAFSHLNDDAKNGFIWWF